MTRPRPRTRTLIGHRIAAKRAVIDAGRPSGTAQLAPEQSPAKPRKRTPSAGAADSAIGMSESKSVAQRGGHAIPGGALADR